MTKTARPVPKLTLRNRCPKCETGEIFSGIFINDCCPHCGLIFGREPGYFLGAVVLSYFASSGIGILIMLYLFAVQQVEIVPAAIVAVLAVAAVMPVLTRFSKILWIQIDHRADPEHSEVGGSRSRRSPESIPKKPL